MTIKWIHELVEFLREKFMEGQSAAVIASQIPGATRNSVIGKIHRLGLNGQQPQKKKKLGVPRPVRYLPKPRGYRSAPIMPVEPLPPPPEVPLLNVRPHAEVDEGLCYWPVYIKDGVQMYCATETTGKRVSYCEAHRAMSAPLRGQRREFTKQIKPGRYAKGYA